MRLAIINCWTVDKRGEEEEKEKRMKRCWMKVWAVIRYGSMIRKPTGEWGGEI